jgi:hypothetical protein
MNKQEVSQNSFEYLPVYRYMGDRSTLSGRMYATAINIARNSFGKRELYEIEKNSGSLHLEGRGDVHHRVGGILSSNQHDELVDMGDKNRKKFLVAHAKRLKSSL